MLAFSRSAFLHHEPFSTLPFLSRSRKKKEIRSRLFSSGSAEFESVVTYHGGVGELLDLLDGLGGTLLEALAVNLDANEIMSALEQYARVSHTSSDISSPRDGIERVAGERRSGLSGSLLTRLCMWMVYSRATTSWMAERCCLPPVFCLVDILGGILVGLSMLEVAACRGLWTMGRIGLGKGLAQYLRWRAGKRRGAERFAKSTEICVVAKPYRAARSCNWIILPGFPRRT